MVPVDDYSRFGLRDVSGESSAGTLWWTSFKWGFMSDHLRSHLPCSRRKQTNPARQNGAGPLGKPLLPRSNNVPLKHGLSKETRTRTHLLKHSQAMKFTKHKSHRGGGGAKMVGDQFIGTAGKAAVLVWSGHGQSPVILRRPLRLKAPHCPMERHYAGHEQTKLP